MKRLISLIFAAFLGFATMSTLFTNIAGAAGGSFGVRGGYDFDAEQFLIGGQAEMGKILEIARFAPSVDFGFGNDLTTIAFNGDIRVFVTPPKASSTIYGGLGLTLFVVDSEGRDSDSEFGLTLSGGVKFGAGKGREYNIEGRFGMDDMPDFRVFFGIFF